MLIKSTRPLVISSKQLLISIAACGAGILLWYLAPASPGTAARQSQGPAAQGPSSASLPEGSLSSRTFSSRESDDTPLARTQAELDAAQERIAELEATVAELAEAWNRFAADEETKRRKASMRGWGPEQAIGAPDTHGGGDKTTAWASLQADGGAEWLQTEYEKPVEVAQVRILENHNPGAVVKITAQLENGTEAVLWQGNEPRLGEPADQVFTIPPGFVASSVRIHLDTAKVPGWNEIDAVELIGRDGSRQWAREATASSSYASQGRGIVDFDTGGNGFLLRSLTLGSD